MCRPPRVSGAVQRGVIFMKITMKQIAPAILVFAGVFLLAGIILLAFLVPGAASSFYKACLAIIAVLCLLIGLGALYLLYLARDNEPNFFLYDTQTSRNMDAADLNFDRVNSRMSYFMTTLSTSQEKLWGDNVLAGDEARFGIKGIYRPLAAYKMLYDLIEIDRPEGWQLFLCASPSVIDALGNALLENGEDAMVQTLHKAYSSATSRDDIEWLRDFVMGNQKYIRRRMLAYVQKNLEWFY